MADKTDYETDYADRVLQDCELALANPEDRIFMYQTYRNAKRALGTESMYSDFNRVAKVYSLLPELKKLF
jgi:hypothetical protein